MNRNTGKTNQLSSNRVGELGDVPGRSERFISDKKNNWFFTTREGAVEGPFESRSHAGKALNEFIEFLAMATPRMPISNQR